MRACARWMAAPEGSQRNPSPRAHPVPVQMWEGCSPGADVSRHEPSPGADVGGKAQSQRRCGWGGPSPGADVGGWVLPCACGDPLERSAADDDEAVLVRPREVAEAAHDQCERRDVVRLAHDRNLRAQPRRQGRLAAGQPHAAVRGIVRERGCERASVRGGSARKWEVRLSGKCAQARRRGRRRRSAR
jgi:hypothetical protein